ncbi:ATP synthase mitochondrial F1 complex assembly factor 1 [Bombina bombina]|uniref:ATP synthase mitochondrial F1 complex assembly factor 1 n=1 Tax=Bombina bombina TaxID=8345 RepID=UPI00235A8055|nr:ATP synthase mitochondrial F1 complex assembly factor 1 [Bombina bombina]
MLSANDRQMSAALLQMSLCYRGMLAVRSRGSGALGLLCGQERTLCVRSSQKQSENDTLTELQNNPHYDKYRDKILRLRSSDPGKFDARMETRDEVKKQPLGFSKQAEFAKSLERKGNASSKGFTKNKTLDSILNLELIKDKSACDIIELWKQYYSTKDTVFAVIPGEAFELIWQRAQSCPSFLYALPRQEGYEFFVGQWSGNELHFTSLINIQTARDSAPSQLILYHFTELQKDKGIALMTSDIDTKYLNVHEAQCLANQVQLFYATDQSESFGLVETFNHKPDEFKYMSVVAFLEKNGLGKSIVHLQGKNKDDN